MEGLLRLHFLQQQAAGGGVAVVVYAEILVDDDADVGNTKQKGNFLFLLSNESTVDRVKGTVLF